MDTSDQDGSESKVIWKLDPGHPFAKEWMDKRDRKDTPEEKRKDAIHQILTLSPDKYFPVTIPL
jgi:hypothetical protein